MVLQLSSIIGVLFFFGMIIMLLRQKTISLKYALLWLLTAVAMLLIGIFPQLLVYIARILGFEVPSNALFTLLLGFIIIILLQQTSVISQHTEKIKTLVQTSALIERRIRELEEKK